MTTNLPLGQLSNARDLRPADASLDGALLKQTGLLATLITARRETALNHAELMRLVQSQRSMLSACRDHARLNDAGQAFAPARKPA